MYELLHATICREKQTSHTHLDLTRSEHERTARRRRRHRVQQPHGRAPSIRGEGTTPPPLHTPETTKARGNARTRVTRAASVDPHPPAAEPWVSPARQPDNLPVLHLPVATTLSRARKGRPFKAVPWKMRRFGSFTKGDTESTDFGCFRSPRHCLAVAAAAAAAPKSAVAACSAYADRPRSQRSQQKKRQPGGPLAPPRGSPPPAAAGAVVAVAAAAARKKRPKISERVVRIVNTPWNHKPRFEMLPRHQVQQPRQH